MKVYYGDHVTRLSSSFIFHILTATSHTQTSTSAFWMTDHGDEPPKVKPRCQHSPGNYCHRDICSHLAYVVVAGKAPIRRWYMTLSLKAGLCATRLELKEKTSANKCNMLAHRVQNVHLYLFCYGSVICNKTKKVGLWVTVNLLCAERKKNNKKNRPHKQSPRVSAHLRQGTSLK